jgi:hypothetical protein
VTELGSNRTNLLSSTSRRSLITIGDPIGMGMSVAIDKLVFSMVERTVVQRRPRVNPGVAFGPTRNVTIFRRIIRAPNATIVGKYETPDCRFHGYELLH